MRGRRSWSDERVEESEGGRKRGRRRDLVVIHVGEACAVHTGDGVALHHPGPRKHALLRHLVGEGEEWENDWEKER